MQLWEISDQEKLFEKFANYEMSKQIDKIEDDLYPEYNPEIMELIEDRQAYRRMILETIYYEYNFCRFHRKNLNNLNT